LGFGKIGDCLPFASAKVQKLSLLTNVCSPKFGRSMEAATFAKAFLNLNKRNLLPGHMCSSLSFFLYFGVTFLMQLISALNEGAGTRGPGDMKVGVARTFVRSFHWAKVFGGVALCVFRTQVGTTHKLVWQQHVAYCPVLPEFVPAHPLAPLS